MQATTTQTETINLNLLKYSWTAEVLLDNGQQISIWHTTWPMSKRNIKSVISVSSDFPKFKISGLNQPVDVESLTKRMIEIEKINMEYNKKTNFGQNPNGQENEIENLLEEWDELKATRAKIKASL